MERHKFCPVGGNFENPKIPKNAYNVENQISQNVQISFLPSRPQSDAFQLYRKIRFEKKIVDLFQNFDSLKKVPKCGNKSDSSRCSNSFFLKIFRSDSLCQGLNPNLTTSRDFFSEKYPFFHGV